MHDNGLEHYSPVRCLGVVPMAFVYLPLMYKRQAHSVHANNKSGKPYNMHGELCESFLS